MDQHELLVTLKTLHAQLTEAGDIDPETDQLLQTVTADIQRALDNDRTKSNPDDSLSERLRTTLIEFEVRHPNVSGLLDRITSGLASIGI